MRRYEKKVDIVRYAGASQMIRQRKMEESVAVGCVTEREEHGRKV